jgi:hypothetical protein
MLDIGKRYKYQMGGFQWKNPDMGTNIQQGAGVLGSFISQLDADDPSTGSGAASGALSGASMGAVAGPIGAAAGAIIGGVMGGINGGKARREKQRAEETQRRRFEQSIRDSSQQVLQNYPTQGVEVSGYYAKYGGQIPSFLTNALAEGGEVAVSNSMPLTDQNGEMNPLASNVSKFEGASHDSSSGGIGFNSTSDTIIFSDALRTPEGITYAKQAELWGKEKGKFESKLKYATDEAAHNTATRMIEKINKRLELLFQHQEHFKNA